MVHTAASTPCVRVHITSAHILETREGCFPYVKITRSPTPAGCWRSEALQTAPEPDWLRHSMWKVSFRGV